MRRAAAFLLASVLACPLTASAEETPRTGTLSFILENDLFITSIAITPMGSG